MAKWAKVITVILFICLIVNNIILLRKNYDISNKVSDDIGFIISKSTQYLPKDYILPILKKKNISVIELYETIAYIDASQSYVAHFLNNEHPDITTYLIDTKKEILELIQLLESNANKASIDKQVNKIDNIQIDILN